MGLRPFFDGRRVLLTGHTGFKGAWLALWLRALGATVSGFALDPDDGQRPLFEGARVADALARDRRGDLRDAAAVEAAFADDPELVFHLAAQSLVRRSYDAPVDTWTTNVVGTAHVLDAARRCPSVRAVVVVTTDKCYENREWHYAYRENDALGGHDPYSASKGAAEILTASWRRSFFAEPGAAGVASARAGNVIGGGDLAVDRLVPDCLRALSAGQPIVVRNPHATRPWQHVLEPLSGYLWLARRLHADPARFGSAWNFGPDADGTGSVREVVERMVDAWGSGRWEAPDAPAGPHEATLLQLDCAKAARLLDWRPTWSLDEAVRRTVDWQRRSDDGGDLAALAAEQIAAYTADARAAGRDWAR